MSESETPFQKACGLFELRLLNAMKVLTNEKQWFAAASLCAVAIDVLADATVESGVATREDYVSFLGNDAAFKEYGEHADRFYASLRCGLLHRMQLKDSGQRVDEEGEPIDEGPIASGDGERPPRLFGDYWVIDVSHLLTAIWSSYAAFKNNPGGQPQRRFAKRMTQVIIEETTEF